MVAQTSWGRDEFMSALFERCPALYAIQDPHVNGLLHCEMGWFSHKTDDAIAVHDFRLVRDHFEFIDAALARASDELENAIIVSYLENVFALDTEQTRWARNLLTPQLSAPMVAMEGHFIAKVDGVMPPIGTNCDAETAAELERRFSQL